MKNIWFYLLTLAIAFCVWLTASIDPLEASLYYTAPTVPTTCHHGWISNCGFMLSECDDGKTYSCIINVEVKNSNFQSVQRDHGEP